ncbi:MAG: hypothetical protein JWP65_3208 [Ramlibacter sp.]|nr:hypothetical protein [Ramlibacter sp.]
MPSLPAAGSVAPAQRRRPAGGGRALRDRALGAGVRVRGSVRQLVPAFALPPGDSSITAQTGPGGARPPKRHGRRARLSAGRADQRLDPRQTSPTATGVSQSSTCAKQRAAADDRWLRNACGRWSRAQGGGHRAQGTGHRGCAATSAVRTSRRAAAWRCRLARWWATCQLDGADGHARLVPRVPGPAGAPSMPRRHSRAAGGSWWRMAATPTWPSCRMTGRWDQPDESRRQDALRPVHLGRDCRAASPMKKGRQADPISMERTRREAYFLAASSRSLAGVTSTFGMAMVSFST